MKNCLYVKIFDNCKMYVGVTGNFDKRMYQHQNFAYSRNSQLPVHRAMRKYGHKTEIWAEGIMDRELILELEKQTISQLREAGVELYNLADGGQGNQMYGENNPSAKDKYHYETSSVLRKTFKRVCANRNWNFDDFKEIFDKRYKAPNDQTMTKYYYIEIGGE